MKRHPQSRKVRRTFTLSPESLAYLDAETRKSGTESQSAVLDQMLAEKQKERQLAAYEAQIVAYYDSLTGEEIGEQRAWGEFAGSHLALKEEELAYAQSAARRDMVHETADGSTRKRKAPGRDRLRQSSKQSSAR